MLPLPYGSGDTFAFLKNFVLRERTVHDRGRFRFDRFAISFDGLKDFVVEIDARVFTTSNHCYLSNWLY